MRENIFKKPVDFASIFNFASLDSFLFCSLLNFYNFEINYIKTLQSGENLTGNMHDFLIIR